MRMWADVAVSLSDVLEVRGSGLSESEAWMLLDELSHQMKEEYVTEQQTIQPDNVQFSSGGNIYINFPLKSSNEYFSEHELLQDISNQQRIICSIGLTILWALQYGLQRTKYISVSNELNSLLDLMISPEVSDGFLDEVCVKCRKKLSHYRFESPSSYFLNLYQSVFGSMIKINPTIPKSKPKTVSTMTEESLATLDQSRQPVIPQEYNQCHGEGVPLQQETLRKDALREDYQKPIERASNSAKMHFPVPTPRRIAREMNTSTDSQHQRSMLTRHESLLKCKDPPLHIKFHSDEKNLKSLVKVAVEFVNEKRITVALNPHKSTCGLLLDSSVTHLVGASDSSLFALAVFVDGEFIFVRNDSKVDKIVSAFGMTTKPLFFLRLKFMPQEGSSYGDEKFVRAIYLQTRRDILDGRILCRQDQALNLAAYALQCEIGGDLEEHSFVIGDYVPAGVLHRIGISNARLVLLKMHSQLHGMTQPDAQKYYICKARELNDFGANFCVIYWSQKCNSQTSAWLGVSYRGVSLFELKQCDIRKKIHAFDWDQLTKIGYKGTCVSFSTNSGTKHRFYVKNPHKSKYIVSIIGATHHLYRFDDCHATESPHQFHNFNSIQRDKPALNSEIVRKSSVILPFKRKTPNQTQVSVVSSSPTPLASEVADDEEALSEAYSGHDEVFPPEDLPEIFPYEPSDDATERRDEEVVTPLSETKNSQPSDNRISPIAIVVQDFESISSQSSKTDSPPVFQPTSELRITDNVSRDLGVGSLTLGGSEPSLADRSCVMWLEKMNGTFGFSIMGGSDKLTTVIKVHHIVDGGAADLDGSLHKGDVILAINDIPLHGVTHKKAVEILSNAPTKSMLTLLRRSSSSVSLQALAEHQQDDVAEVFALNDSHQSPIDLEESDFPNVALEKEDQRPRIDSYDDRVLQVASAFYNNKYTDIEPQFQHAYIGSGGEGLSLTVGAGVTDSSLHEETAIRGEGDGVSTLSAQDHGPSQMLSPRDSETDRSKKEDEILTAASETIANFEEFRRRMSQLQDANRSSENSEDTESWTTVDN